MIRVFTNIFETKYQELKDFKKYPANVLIQNYEESPKEIKDFIDNYNDSLLCRDISLAFCKKYPEAELIIGSYFIGNLAADHVWISYKGKEYDLRAIKENFEGLATYQYDMISRLRKYKGSDLKIRRDRGNYEVTNNPKPKTLYFSS